MSQNDDMTVKYSFHNDVMRKDNIISRENNALNNLKANINKSDKLLPSNLKEINLILPGDRKQREQRDDKNKSEISGKNMGSMSLESRMDEEENKEFYNEKQFMENMNSGLQEPDDMEVTNQDNELEEINELIEQEIHEDLKNTLNKQKMNIIEVEDDNNIGPVIVHDDPDSYPSL